MPIKRALPALIASLAFVGCTKQTGTIINVDVKQLAGGRAVAFDQLEFFFATQAQSSKDLPSTQFAFAVSGNTRRLIRNFQAQDIVSAADIRAAGDTFELYLPTELNGKDLIVVGFVADKAVAVGAINNLVVDSTKLRTYPIALDAIAINKDTMSPELRVFGNSPATLPHCLIWNPPNGAGTEFVARADDDDCDGVADDKCNLVADPATAGIPEVCDGYDSGADCVRAPEDPTPGLCAQRADVDEPCLLGEGRSCADEGTDPWLCGEIPKDICVSALNCERREEMLNTEPGTEKVPLRPPEPDFICKRLMTLQGVCAGFFPLPPKVSKCEDLEVTTIAGDMIPILTVDGNPPICKFDPRLRGLARELMLIGIDDSGTKRLTIVQFDDQNVDTCPDPSELTKCRAFQAPQLPQPLKPFVTCD
jgi:hypothetical protein